MSLRALDVLQSASLIVAEDTRVAQRLLSAHGISGKALKAFHAHSLAHTIEEILAHAQEFSVVAMTDAGMPGVSDPGSELIRAARAANIPVDLLPGPCAFISAAVLSGFPIVGVSFEGFVPRPLNARRLQLENALKSGRTTTWYESPHRIISTLTTLDQIAPDAQIFVLREYTKLFEQQIHGTPLHAVAALALPVKGELTLVLRGRTDAQLSAQNPGSPATFEARLATLIAEGLSTAAIAKRLAAEGWGNRSELYIAIAQREKLHPLDN